MTAVVRLALAAGAAALAGLLVVHEHDNPAFSTGRLALVLLVGLVMVAAGLVASVNGEDRVGLLVVLAGYAWLGERCLLAIPSDLTVTLGAVLVGAWFPLLAHALVTFPSGRIGSRVDGAVVMAGYAINIGLTVVRTLFLPFGAYGLQERNLLAVFEDVDTALWITERSDELTLAWIVVLVVLMVGKAVSASPAARRAYGAVWAAGVVLAANTGVIVAAGLEIFSYREAYDLWLEIVAGLAPATLAATLVAIRLSEDRLVRLVADLQTVGPGTTLRGALRRALSDPGLDITYLHAGTGGWIDDGGRAMTSPYDTTGRAVSTIERGGEPIAALVHDPVLLRNPERLRAATGAAGLALHNEQLKAELRAQLLDVRASRARIVEAGDRERQRVERNLHDGAQQRLVGLALTLRLLRSRADAGADPATIELLEEAARDLDDALSELRELSRGLHPSIVTESGLGAAFEMLAERPGTPVALDIDLPEPLPEAVAVGAYYVVAEALANVNKHAGATEARLSARIEDGVLRVGVADDGGGGASATPGSGLEGLSDRVAALGGRLAVNSPVAGGTSLVAEIPLDAGEAPVPARATEP